MNEGTIAGRYELEEALGGSSWRATDTELGRQVLVRFGAIGERAATLSHPSIARVFDQGEADGERYAVLEYLPGGALGAHLRELDDGAARAIAADVAAALAYAHAQGVVHGSLALSSVLLDGEGRAKVAGFGTGGTPEEDVRAFGAILEALAKAAPALAPVAAAALAGELDSAELYERIRAAEPTVPVEQPTAVLAPPAAALAPPPRRRTGVLVAVAVLALLLAGLAAALLATGGSSTADLTTESLSVPVPTETTLPETEAPPPETEETTTKATTTTKAKPKPKPKPKKPKKRTTNPQPAPLPTTVELPPTTTEEPPPPPPPTTTEPPPTTTSEATPPPADG